MANTSPTSHYPGPSPISPRHTGNFSFGSDFANTLAVIYSVGTRSSSTFPSFIMSHKAESICLTIYRKTIALKVLSWTVIYIFWRLSLQVSFFGFYVRLLGRRWYFLRRGFIHVVLPRQTKISEWRWARCWTLLQRGLAAVSGTSWPTTTLGGDQYLFLRHSRAGLHHSPAEGASPHRQRRARTTHAVSIFILQNL